MLQLLGELCEQWSNRLVLTLLIIALLDYWHRSRWKHDQPGAPTISESPEVERNLTEQSHRQSRLLDELENEEGEDCSEEGKPEAREKETDVSSLKREVQRPAKHINDPQDFSSGQKAPSNKKRDKQTVRNDTDPPPMKARSNTRPGTKGFHHWQEVETSLFRIYTLGRNDGVQVFPPYVPHSYRGTVPIFLHVTNTTSIPIKVFWVNFQGQAIFKGTLRPDNFWTQTTWIDHPWVFEHAETQEVLLYYIPYRVIPTSRDVNTVSEDGVGQHKFSLVPPRNSNCPYWIGVRDDVLPFPAVEYFPTSILATAWTLQHMSRLMSPEDPSIHILQKYLRNIVENPASTKYRQIRLRSGKFAPIWQSTLKGLLLAIGFVEQEAFAELGCNQELPREWVQEVALLSYLVNKWKEEEQQRVEGFAQPEGYDGFGRQGFGRAGQMN